MVVQRHHMILHMFSREAIAVELKCLLTLKRLPWHGFGLGSRSRAAVGFSAGAISTFPLSVLPKIKTEPQRFIASPRQIKDLDGH